MYAMTGFTTFGVVMLGQNSTPGTLLTCTNPFSSGVNNCPYQPGGAYKSIPFGGLAHISGSIYSYLNSTTGVWHNIDLSTVGIGTGVSSLNSLTGGLSLTGTYLTVTPSGSAINLALPQSIATTATPAFVSVQSTSTTSALSFSTANGNFQVDGLGNISIAGTGSVINVNGSAGGVNIANDTNGNSIQTIGGVKASQGYNVGTYGGSTTQVINSSGQWVGSAIYSAGTNIDISSGTISTSATPSFTSVQTTSTTGTLAFSTANGNFQVDGLGNISLAGTGSVINVNGSAGGLNITNDTNGASIQSVGGINLNLGAAATTGFTIHQYSGASVDAFDLINSLSTTIFKIGSLGTVTAPGFVGTNTTTNNIFQNAAGTFAVTGAADTTVHNLTVNGSCTGCSSGVITLNGYAGSLNLQAGTAISIGSALTINNTGVIALYGTANEISASASTGAITLSTPQAIDTGASPTFNALTSTTQFRSMSTTSALSFSTNNSNFQVDGLGNISIAGTGSIISIQGSTGGLNIINDTNGASIQSVGGINLLLGAAATVGLNIKQYSGASVDAFDLRNSSNSIIMSIGNAGTVNAPGFNMNSTGGITVNGSSGVTSTTCTQWTYGICTHS
jgi:hypothetical protein